jgi:hypothetical protein
MSQKCPSLIKRQFFKDLGDGHRRDERFSGRSASEERRLGGRSDALARRAFSNRHSFISSHIGSHYQEATMSVRSAERVYLSAMVPRNYHRALHDRAEREDRSMSAVLRAALAAHLFENDRPTVELDERQK